MPGGEEATHEEQAKFFQDRYLETGNPLLLLSAFCYLSATPDDAGNVVFPQWMTDQLSAGFAGYLDGLTADQNTNLEKCLHITKGHKQAAVRTSLDHMAEWVHRIVWLFGISTAEAAHAVYMEFESYIKTMGLPLKQQGITRDEKGFVQFYHRGAKKGFAAFMASANRATPTDAQRNELLTNWGAASTKYIRQKAKYKTL